MGSTRVLVVDDADTFRVATAQVVASVSGLEVVAIARTGEEAVEIIRTDSIDLVLMDIVLPGVDGIEAARRVHEMKPSTTVILLSAYSPDDLPALPSACSWCSFCAKEEFGPEVLEEWCRARRT